VHLAAIAHRSASADELQRVNVQLAEEVGRTAAADGAHMIFVSSVKVHGEESEAAFRESSPIAPSDAYARSKAHAEEALRAIGGLRVTVLRPPLVYGPAVKANFLSLMRALARGLPLPLASVSNRRSLVYVGNLADAIQLCLQTPGAVGRTYLLSDGPPVSTPELCRRLAGALGRRARLFRLAPSLIPVRSLTRSLEIDDSAIRHTLGWTPPSSLDEGLRATAAWYRNR
jgi:nucleoside-diphosphate-sugar epimerase